MSARHSVLVLAAGVLLASCSHGSMNSTSIANGGITVRGEQVALHGAGGAEARLDAAGDLVIGGQPVALDATQRQLLQQYYQGARAVREHGIATGKAGAAIGLQALKSAATHVTGGDGAKADASLDAASRRVDEEASKICLDLRQIKAAQDRLATSLAQFKPFAGILDAGDARCGNQERTVRGSASGGEVELRSDKDGLVVRQTPADGFYGLQPGDRVVAIDGTPVDSVDAFLDRLGGTGTETADLQVIREGKTVALAVPRQARALFQ